MKKTSILMRACTAVLALTTTALVWSYSDDPEPETPPVDTAGTVLAVAGTAAGELPEEAKVLSEDNGIYTYSGPLSAGELTLKATVDGKSRFLYFSEDFTTVAATGEARQTARGYYEFQVDLAKETVAVNGKVEFGSADTYLYGGEVFMPRTGNADYMPVMQVSSESNLKYEYVHYLGKGPFRFYFQDDTAQSCAYRDQDGKAVFLAGDRDKGSTLSDWTVPEPGGYRITLDLLTREVDITPVTFYPDNMEALYVVGNTFSNAGDDPAEVDANLTAPGSSGAVKMTRSAQDPDVFTATGDLEAGSGGIWFLFQPRHSVPALVNDGSGTATFFFSASDTEDDDIQAAAHWTVPEDDNYTVTVNIKTGEVTVDYTVPKVRVIPDGYDLYVAGPAAEAVPEEMRKFTLTDAGVFEYDLVLQAGQLSLVAKKDGEADIELGFDQSDKTVGGSGAPMTVIKGFHKLTVEPVAGGYTYAEGMGLGEYVYMHAAHINYPRYGLYHEFTLYPVAAREDNPFVYEVCNHFFNLTHLNGDAASSYSFYLAQVLNNNDIRLGMGADGKLVIGHSGEADWPMGPTGEYRITLDLLKMEYNVEPITLYPGNVQQVWMIGNTFSSKVKTAGDDAGQVTNLEADALHPSDMYGPSMIDRYTFGWNYWDENKTPFPMTRDTGDPNKFTITHDLDEDLGGFWFLLRPKGSLPAIINDGTGKAVYYPGEEDLPDDGHGASSYSSRLGRDIQTSGHWQVPAGSGSYTITLDISTGDVTVTKN